MADDTFTRGVLGPDECRAIEPALAGPHGGDVWVYRYEAPARGWRLSIATHAEPGSRRLSLGGFRIAPAERTELPGFDADREAIDLAIGMEEKVYWSRLVKAGGPLALRDSNRIVGGKCVMHPTPDARVGKPRDRELLDFAVACFRDVEATAGIHLTTGQDLGHGTMSDGRTPSLAYLNARFKGSVLADTSKPTAEGNYQLLAGMLRAVGIPIDWARIGLIGCGNIGAYIGQRLVANGARCVGLESSPARRAIVEATGVTAWTADRKDELLGMPVDAIVVNAAGGSLDADTVARIAANPSIRIVCGSENLAMPDPGGAEALRAAGKLYAPTELGGMMGYLTAVEEYLAHLEGIPFDIATLFGAAKRLETVGHEAGTLAVQRGFAIGFEDAVREMYGAAVRA